VDKNPILVFSCKPAKHTRKRIFKSKDLGQLFFQIVSRPPSNGARATNEGLNEPQWQAPHHLLKDQK